MGGWGVDAKERKTSQTETSGCLTITFSKPLLFAVDAYSGQFILDGASQPLFSRCSSRSRCLSPLAASFESKVQQRPPSLTSHD